MNAVKEDIQKRFTLAIRAVSLEALIVTGGFSGLMIVWACFTEDKRLLFIPLFCLSVSFFYFVWLLFRYFTEPKIAIQADCKGIYFYYRNNKEIFIDFNDIVEVLACKSYNSYGEISISTQNGKYKSITIRGDKSQLSNNIRNLLNTENKQEYLMKIEIRQK